MQKQTIKYVFEFEAKFFLTGLGIGKLIAADEKELLIKFKKAYLNAQFIKVLNKTPMTNELPTIQRTNRKRNKKANYGTGNEFNFNVTEYDPI